MKEQRGYQYNLNYCALVFFLMLNIQIFGQTTQDILKLEIKITDGQTYLNFPVNTSDPMVRTTISLDGKSNDSFTINLASGNLQLRTFFDVSPGVRH